MPKYRLLSPYGKAPYVDKKSTPAPQLNQEFDDLHQAQKAADGLRQYGYIVYDDEGNAAYNPCGTLLAAKILYHAKINADHARDEGYKYGDASANPALDKTEKVVSCDRFTAWTLYDAGVNTDNQPPTKGYTMYTTNNFEQFLIQQNFTKITDKSEVQAGDIMFTGYSFNIPVPDDWKASPKHTFICAGKATRDNYYRYDAGSDQRLQSTQPSVEVLSYTDNVFRYAYRVPKETE